MQNQIMFKLTHRRDNNSRTT